ncbi:MAG: hypothetical protein AB7I44_19480 [Hyphomicrobiaceae bacterium]
MSRPASAIDSLLSAKLIEPAVDGDTIVCRGCEERCERTVNVLDRNDGSIRLIVSTCDLFDNLGPFFHSHQALARWQTSRQMITQFLRRECSLTVADQDELQRHVRFRSVELQGFRRSISLEFRAYPVVRIGTLDIELETLISWEDQIISIDRDYLQDCFRSSQEQRSGDKPYQHSRTVQQENKAITEIRDQRMQRDFETLAGQHPKLNKEQLAVRLRRDKNYSEVSVGRILRIVRMPPSRQRKLGRKKIA